MRKFFESVLVVSLVALLTLIGASCAQPVVAPGASPSPSASPSVAPAESAAAPGTSATPGAESMSATQPAAAATRRGAPISGSAPAAATRPAASTGGNAAAEQERVAVPKPPPPPPPPPRTFTLASGRSIAIFTENSISTKTSRSGDVFVASLANPIVDGDWVIAKKGARVEGVVTNSDPGGRVKGVASLSVRLKSLQLADGRTVAISTSSYAKEAKSTKKKDAVKIGIGAGIGAAIGAIAGGGKGAAIGAGVGGGGGTAAVMATRGDPAVIPSESQLTFRLTSPVTVTKGH